MAEAVEQGLPQPDPALRALDRFVGTWKMEGHLIGCTGVESKRPSSGDD